MPVLSTIHHPKVRPQPPTGQDSSYDGAKENNNLRFANFQEAQFCTNNLEGGRIMSIKDWFALFFYWSYLFLNIAMIFYGFRLYDTEQGVSVTR